MTPAQCRAARELLDWTQIKLAEASRIAVATVIRFERNGRPVAAEAVQTIQRALETADIEFIDKNGAGVKLRAKGKRK
jgi:transcriptional regulator with XRE-family HTH domain